jgi:trk system potassium uptake protein TrkH
MLLPLGYSFFLSEACFDNLGSAAIMTLIPGVVLYLTCRRTGNTVLSAKDAITIVALGWVLSGLFGALPFYLSGEFGSFTNSFFESVSGFTTTGSSILKDIESISKGLLLWRSLIQWLGGMGIIVLSIAILPFLGVGGMELYKAEVPSPVPDKLKPRIQETAKILWKVYLSISVMELLLLLLGGMSFFDALCHTFTTLPTGGFSTRNTSVAGFSSTYIDLVIVAFMLLSGINFSLHYQFLRGKPLAFWRDAECRFFLGMVVIFVIAVSLNIHGIHYDTVGQTVRYASFQVVSIITTTGYATADYEQWPALSQLILLVCMFIGASAGSTGGGIKCLRIMVCLKYCYREVFALIHPRAVTLIKIGGISISNAVIRNIMGFIGLYAVIFILSTVLLAAMDVDLATAIGAVAASLGNIGPGFGMVGPADNYAGIPDAGKWLLIWCMLVGRLEIFTIIILMVPAFWRK